MRHRPQPSGRSVGRSAGRPGWRAAGRPCGSVAGRAAGRGAAVRALGRGSSGCGRTNDPSSSRSRRCVSLQSVSPSVHGISSVPRVPRSRESVGFSARRPAGPFFPLGASSVHGSTGRGVCRSIGSSVCRSATGSMDRGMTDRLVGACRWRGRWVGRSALVSAGPLCSDPAASTLSTGDQSMDRSVGRCVCGRLDARVECGRHVDSPR